MCEEKGNPIKEDWSNIDCRDFDKFNKDFGYETATNAWSFSYHLHHHDTIPIRLILWALLRSLRTYSYKVWMIQLLERLFLQQEQRV